MMTILYLRSFIAFLGYLTFWTGLEQVLDENYILPASWWKEILYVILGLLMLVLTDTFHVNAGVLTPMSYRTNLSVYTDNVMTLTHVKSVHDYNENNNQDDKDMRHDRSWGDDDEHATLL